MSFPSPGSTFTYHEPGKGTYQGFVETYVNGRARVRNGHNCRIRYLEANEVEKIKNSPTKCSENLNRDILTLVNVDVSDGWNEGLWQLLREKCGWVWNKSHSIYQRPTSINRTPMKKRKIKEQKDEAKQLLGVAGRDYFRCGEDAVRFILQLQERHKNGTAIEGLVLPKEKENSKIFKEWKNFKIYREI